VLKIIRSNEAGYITVVAESKSKGDNLNNARPVSAKKGNT